MKINIDIRFRKTVPTKPGSKGELYENNTLPRKQRVAPNIRNSIFSYKSYIERESVAEVAACRRDKRYDCRMNDQQLRLDSTTRQTRSRWLLSSDT